MSETSSNFSSMSISSSSRSSLPCRTVSKRKRSLHFCCRCCCSHSSTSSEVSSSTSACCASYRDCYGEIRRSRGPHDRGNFFYADNRPPRRDFGRQSGSDKSSCKRGPDPTWDEEFESSFYESCFCTHCSRGIRSSASSSLSSHLRMRPSSYLGTPVDCSTPYFANFTNDPKQVLIEASKRLQTGGRRFSVQSEDECPSDFEPYDEDSQPASSPSYFLESSTSCNSIPDSMKAEKGSQASDICSDDDTVSGTFLAYNY